MKARDLKIAVEILACQIGLELHAYSSIRDPETLEKAKLFSEHGFLLVTSLRNLVFFNDSDTTDEIAFTLGHEIGHFVTGSESEAVADKFARDLLKHLIKGGSGFDFVTLRKGA